MPLAANRACGRCTALILAAQNCLTYAANTWGYGRISCAITIAPFDVIRVIGRYTPLRYAAANNHPDVARRLIAAGADVDARDSNG